MSKNKGNLTPTRSALGVTLKLCVDTGHRFIDVMNKLTARITATTTGCVE
jgi:hypothetical protein